MRACRSIIFFTLTILLTNVTSQMARGDDANSVLIDHETSNYQVEKGTEPETIDDLPGGLVALDIFSTGYIWVIPEEESPGAEYDVHVEFETVVPMKAISIDFDLGYAALESGPLGEIAASIPTAQENAIYNWADSKFDVVTSLDNIPVNLYAEPGTGRVLVRHTSSYDEVDAIVKFAPTWKSRPYTIDANVSVPLTAVNAPDVADSGIRIGGGVDDLVAPYDSYLVYESQNNSPVVLDFSTSLCEFEADNPGRLELHLETRVDTPNVDQTVSIYNWKSGEFDEIQTTAEGVTDQEREIDLSDSVVEYVRPVVGEIRWRIQWSPTDATNSNNWQVEVDQAVLLTEESETTLLGEFFDQQELRFQELVAYVEAKHANDMPDFDVRNETSIRRIYNDYAVDFPSINELFWLAPIDFSGTSWSEFSVSLITNFVQNDSLGRPVRRGGHTASPTLITPQVFTFAFHCNPFGISDHRFDDQIWADADGNVENPLVTKIYKIPGTDIGIGMLDSPIQNPNIKQYKIAALGRVKPERFEAGGELENAKIILADMFGEVFLGKITGNENGDLFVHHSPIAKGYPSDDVVSGDSSNPLYLLAPNDELIVVSSHQGSTLSPMLGAYIDEINAHIQSPDGFGLPDQAVEVYDLRAQSVLLGDVNCDGVVDFFDIGAFIQAISNSNYEIKADINQDGIVNFFDIGPFIAILAGS